MKRSFYERHAFKILFVVALLLVPVLGGARLALKSNKNDVKQWLPAQYTETRLFQWFRQHFAGDEFILASWEGCTLDDDRLRLLVDKLVPAKKDARTAPNARFFKEVITGASTLERLTSEPINLPPQQALERLRGSLIGPDGKTTCVVFTLSDEGKEHVRDSVAAVRNTASEECNIKPDKLHLGGPPVDNVAIDEAGEKSLYKLAGWAGAIGLAISWWCLRSKRLVTFVFFAGIYSAALSLALVWYSPLVLGHRMGWISMNAILLTMPSLVYVATVSGAIHLANYYRDELNQGGEVHGAPERSIRHAALPLSLATLTTSVGLATLCYSELVPIQLFGLFSALGVVGSALLLFLFLPAAFQNWPLKPHEAQAALPEYQPNLVRRLQAVPWRHVGEGVIRRHGIVAATCVALFVVCAYGMTRIQTSVHLMRLFPPDAKILADYRWLESNLGELVPLEIVFKIDPKRCPLTFLEQMKLVDLVHKRVEAISNVGSALSAVSFAPRLPRPEDYRRSGGIMGTFEALTIKDKYGLALRQYNKYLEQHRNDYIEGDYLAVDNGRDLWRISARVGALKDVDYGEVLKQLKQNEVDPIIRRLEAIVAQPAGEQAAVSAAVSAGGGAKGRQNASLDAIDRLSLALEQQPNAGAAGGEANQAAGPAPGGAIGIEAVYTGLVPLIYKAQRSLLQGLIFGFVTDFILITLVMMVAVRDWSAGLILAMPSIFPAIVIFGLMGWLGIVVDIGTVMAPAVALGVTVDDVVHFMIKCRHGLKLGLGRRGAVMLAYESCARPMYQSWGVIGLGLSVFALSPFTPTQRFGYLMVGLLTAALVGNLLLLPALLAGPLGALFGRRYVQRPLIDGDEGGGSRVVNSGPELPPAGTSAPPADGRHVPSAAHGGAARPLASDHARRGIRTS